jgi:predicted metal-dependent hydrolase
MTNQMAVKELAAAQRRVMNAWRRLEEKRSQHIDGLRSVQQDMAALEPVLNAVLKGKTAA